MINAKSDNQKHDSRQNLYPGQTRNRLLLREQKTIKIIKNLITRLEL